MRIRKNAKISAFLHTNTNLSNASDESLCHLNQSPWDIITFPSSDSSSSLHQQFDDNEVYCNVNLAGNGNSVDSIGDLESDNHCLSPVTTTTTVSYHHNHRLSRLADFLRRRRHRFYMGRTFSHGSRGGRGGATTSPRDSTSGAAQSHHPVGDDIPISSAHASDKPPVRFTYSRRNKTSRELEDMRSGDDVPVAGSSVGRGLNAMRFGRPFIEVAGGKFTDPEVTRQITAHVKTCFKGPWHSWKKVDHASKAQLWQLFKQRYQWDPNMESLVEQAWDKQIHSRWSDMLGDVRDDAVAAYERETGSVWDRKTRDFSLLKHHGKPEWIAQADWETMIDNVWNTDSWKAKSAKSSQNRNTLVDGVVAKHCGGSINMVQRRLKMQKEKGGIPPTGSEIFIATHCRKRGPGETSGSEPEFIHPKAVNFYVNLKRVMAEEFGKDTSTHPPVNTDIWTHVAGGARKGRLYGVGKVSNAEFVLTGSQNPYVSISRSNVGGGSTSSDEVQRLRQQVDELKEANHRMRREMEERTEERIQRERKEIEQQMEDKMRKEIEQQMEDKMRTMMASMMSGYPLPVGLESND